MFRAALRKSGNRRWTTLDLSNVKACCRATAISSSGILEGYRVRAFLRASWIRFRTRMSLTNRQNCRRACSAAPAFLVKHAHLCAGQSWLTRRHDRTDTVYRRWNPLGELTIGSSSFDGQNRTTCKAAHCARSRTVVAISSSHSEPELFSDFCSRRIAVFIGRIDVHDDPSDLPVCEDLVDDV